MEKNKRLKKVLYMNGKILVCLISIVIAALIVTIFAITNNSKSYENTILLGNKEYKFNIYSVELENISFNRSDEYPKLFKIYSWLPAATAHLGAVFLQNMSNDQLKLLFEKPSDNPSLYVAELLRQTDLGSSIRVIGLIKFKGDSDEFLYLSMKTSDFPNYVQYSLLKRMGDRWVIPANNRNSGDDLPTTAKNLYDEIMESGNNKIKYDPISRLR